MIKNSIKFIPDFKNKTFTIEVLGKTKTIKALNLEKSLIINLETSCSKEELLKIVDFFSKDYYLNRRKCRELELENFTFTLYKSNRVEISFSNINESIFLDFFELKEIFLLLRNEIDFTPYYQLLDSF